MAPHHIIALLLPAWGHTTSYIHLATQMLQKDPTLVITMFHHNILLAQMEAELQTCTYDRKRLRMVGVGEADVPFAPDMVKQVVGQLLGGWMQGIEKLIKGSEEYPIPQALHLDFIIGGFVIGPTKQLLQTIAPDCKTLVWWSSALASMPCHLTDYDYVAIAHDIYADEVRRDGRSEEEIMTAVGLAWNGTDKISGLIVKTPGLPDMYDYERIAYGSPPPEGIDKMLTAAQALAKAADGYIVPTANCIERAGITHCREMYGKRNQELFTIGLQSHELSWTDAPPTPPTNELVRSFLDTSLTKYGPKSVLYISFGSMFFPIATPQLVVALVETLIALDPPFPFVFALGGKMASLPAELIERANASGKGIICGFWVEQRAILQHAALGWFLTHGGFNSVSESLSQGIPLIVWPTNAEQPVNAALLSSGDDAVAFELVQVRCGPGLAPSLRGGPKITGTVEDAKTEFTTTLAAARDPKGSGARLKANAVKMRDALRAARAGEVADEIVRLAKF